MAKKDDLIEAAKARGIELGGNETVAEIEAMLSEIVDPPPQPDVPSTLTRAKVNRGSRRRIERAITHLNAEIDAALRELDHQAFLADENGNRTGEWNAVTILRKARQEVNELVNELLSA